MHCSHNSYRYAVLGLQRAIVDITDVSYLGLFTITVAKNAQKFAKKSKKRRNPSKLKKRPKKAEKFAFISLENCGILNSTNPIYP
jgi:hypothetical protein